MDQSKYTYAATTQTPRIGKRNLGRLKNRYMDSEHARHESGQHGGTSKRYSNIKQNTSLSTTSSC
jgi:hypothetical protein